MRHRATLWFHAVLLVASGVLLVAVLRTIQLDAPSSISDHPQAVVEGIETPPDRSSEVLRVESSTETAAEQSDRTGDSMDPSSVGLPEGLDTRTGSLRVVVRTGLARLAAREVSVFVRGPYEERWRDLRPDGAGVCQFHGLVEGTAQVTCDRGGAWRAPITPGDTYELLLTLERGFDVTGIVVDRAGVPVAGATIWRSSWFSFVSGFPVAHSEVDGTFRIHGLAEATAIAARASLHAPSAFVSVSAASPSITLKVDGSGADILGTVKTDRGLPIADALVTVGDSGFQYREEGQYSTKATAVTGAEGHFSVVGMPAGRTGVLATARGYVPHARTVNLRGGEVLSLDLSLSTGAMVSGRVADSGGRVLRGVRVRVVEHELADYLADAVSDTSGSYRLGGLPAGDMTLVASNKEGAQARKRVSIRHLESIEWHPRLEAPEKLKVVLTDQGGRPLEGWRVAVVGGANHAQSFTTDLNGEVGLNQPDGDQLRLRAYHPNCGAFPCVTSSWNVGAEGSLLPLVVSESKLPTVYVTGVLEGSETARLTVTSESLETASWTVQRGVAFRLGPIPPGRYEGAAYAQGYKNQVFSRSVLPGEEWALGTIAMATVE